jgi:hypothetical protein
LLLVVDAGEAEAAHLRRVLRVSVEMKDAGALTVIQITFAIKLAGIAREHKLDLLLARF